MTDMTHDTTTPTTPTTGRPLLPIPPTAAWTTVTAGGILTAASAFLSWTWTSTFPGDLTVTGYPGGLQLLTLTAGLITTLIGLSGLRTPGLRWLTPAGAEAPALLAALGGLTTTWYTALAIATELHGLANLTTGGWLAVAASAIPLIGALGLPQPPTPEHLPERFGATAQHRLRALFARRHTPAPLKPLPAPAEWTLITLTLALALAVFVYCIDTSYGELFVGFLFTAGFALWALSRAGLTDHFTTLRQRHPRLTMTLSFIAAAAFTLTQSNDHNANIGVNILIFATVALGLNIVVGLTGLLDLGYVAFLGVGAYTAAIVSGSPYSPAHTTFPFWAAVLAGAAAALIFGVLIGAPTLRLRGDYLAIVTLGFGEIFRIVVQNLDGTSGPDVTNGPNGIASIPDLSILGLNLGKAHSFWHFTIGRFANYYLLMLIATLIVVTIYRRAADSRIGRSWIAIREDETAALAMGINGFRVKLTAFALGACLAGFAGTVSAHVTYNVVPDPYQFAGPVAPNSAFLLAAVVLGGMGTVSGPLLGAALLYLIPEKLQFLNQYQLLVFGLSLVLMVRFRPEGIIPDRRRQLELHDTGEPATGPDGRTPEPQPDLTQAGA